MLKSFTMRRLRLCGPNILQAMIPVLLALAAPAFADPSAKVAQRLLAIPSTRPSTPVLKATAVETPVDLRGAAGDLAEWLKGFDVPQREFPYTTQVVSDDGECRVERVVFDSAFVSPYPMNNVVPCELYEPVQPQGAKRPAAKMPAAVVLDILDGRAIIARAMARALAGHGVVAMYVPMAYYGERKPPAEGRVQLFTDQDQRSIDALRQTVMDIRRAKAVLLSRPEVDANQIGITGVSLGGIMTSLAAGVDGSFARVVPILAGGDIANLVFHVREMRSIKKQLDLRGVTQDMLTTYLAPVEPTHFTPRIARADCLMINAAADEVIPKDATELLAKSIGNPQLFWMPTGHYTAILLMPAIEETAARFLSGQKVERFGFESPATQPSTRPAN